MLKEMDLESIDELFSEIPEEIRINGLELDQGKNEIEINRIMKEIGAKNISLDEIVSLLGAGVYHHYTPVIVDYLSSRSEFLTSYTPYQGEISQGMLQGLFEYQSYIAELTGMDVSNSSQYDWATAIGEAALMCKRTNRRNKFLVASPLPKKKISVIENYTKYQGMNLELIPPEEKSGKMDLEKVKEHIDDDTAGVYVELPNFFGILEDDIKELRDFLGSRRRRPLLVIGYNLIISPLMKTPGQLGGDIAVGDVNLGNPPSFGGPSAGYLSCKKEFVRKLPGRLIGYTKDSKGEDAFVMTLQTREQHIKRNRATSNICSNQALCALRFAMTLASLGPKGLRRLAEVNIDRSHKLKEVLEKFSSVSIRFSGGFFNEFVVSLDLKDGQNRDIYEELKKEGILFGYPLEKDFPKMKRSYLLCATEMTDDGAIEKIVTAFSELGVK